MNLRNIKQQSIVDYLQQQGYSPQHIRGNAYWYCSPFRNKQTASFKVNTERNQWYDFATGEHDDIIDLVCILQHCSIAEAMKHLSSANNTSPVSFSTPATPSFSFGGTSIPATSPAHHIELISVKPITHPKLLQYLAERGLKKSDVLQEKSDVYSFSCEISYKKNRTKLSSPWDLRMTQEVGNFAILISRAAWHRSPSVQSKERTDSDYKSSRALWTFSLGANSIPK